jgi:hypothetical protein
LFQAKCIVEWATLETVMHQETFLIFLVKYNTKEHQEQKKHKRTELKVQININKASEAVLDSINYRSHTEVGRNLFRKEQL